MIKNLWYKVLSIALVLIAVIMTIAYSPKAYTPIITNTATLDFGSTGPGASTDLTITVTGAALNDAVIVGVPNGSVVASGGFTGWVSATNTVTVRYTNPDAITSYNPASGTFRGTIIKQ